MTVTSESIDEIVDGNTVPQQFLATLATMGENVFLRWKDSDGVWQQMTRNVFADQVARVANGLKGQGVVKGDRVMMVLSNRPEFHVLDTAIMFLGATPVSIYNSSSPEQVEYLCNDAEAKLVIAEQGPYLDCVLKARPNLKTLSGVGSVRALDEAQSSPDAGADFTFEQLEANEPIDLVAVAALIKPDDLATLIYTSGTTGSPKGVMLDHYNVCWTAETLKQCLNLDKFEGQKLVSYLPMAHIAERMLSHYLAMALGFDIACCPDARELRDYLLDIKPNIVFGVPRVWEKIYSGVQAKVAEDPEKQQKLAEGVAAGLPIREKMTAGTATQEEIDTYDFLDAVAFSTVRELVGLGEIVAAVSGAAPLSAEILSWCRTVGIPLSEIYGLSETSGPMTWEAWNVKPGYVGPPCPGVEVKLADDGEVLCRGGNIFRGYLNQPEKTAEVLDDEGWFFSGDIGEFDADGFLKIVDRKKELIVTAGGKNVSPANLELALKNIPIVGQAVVVGDQQPFIAALVVLDPEVAPVWANQQGIDGTLKELADNDAVKAEIEAWMPKVMESFSAAEKVKKFTVLGEEWLPDGEVLTATSKLKRRGAHAKYKAEIAALYS